MRASVLAFFECKELTFSSRAKPIRAKQSPYAARMSGQGGTPWQANWLAGWQRGVMKSRCGGDGAGEVQSCRRRGFTL